MSGVSLAVGMGLICALLSALGTNLSFLFKYKGAVAAPDVEMRHPLRSAIDLFRAPPMSSIRRRSETVCGPPWYKVHPLRRARLR